MLFIEKKRPFSKNKSFTLSNVGVKDSTYNNKTTISPFVSNNITHHNIASDIFQYKLVHLQLVTFCKDTTFVYIHINLFLETKFIIRFIRVFLLKYKMYKSFNFKENNSKNIKHRTSGIKKWKHIN